MNEYTPIRKAELTGIAEAGMMSRLAIREQVAGIVPADQLKTPDDRMRQYARLEQMIGNTPLDSWHLYDTGATIWIKREAQNPSESHYDRVSVTVLKRLETEGFIKPGDRILEGTSGSAGRSFAWACSRLGYKLDMIVPHADEFPAQRSRDMEALGANLIHADERGGIGKVTRQFKIEMIKLRRAGYEDEQYKLEGKPIIIFRKENETIVAPNHSEIIITPNAFRSIADEIISQLPEGVRIDTFISTLGNGSTLKGISERLRVAYGNLQVFGIEHRNSPTNAIRKLRDEIGEEGMRNEFERLYGFKMPEKGEMTYHDSFGASTPGYEPPFVETDKLDGIVLVDQEWRDFKRRVNTYAWLGGNPKNLIGNTTAENLYAALMLAQCPSWTGKNILVIHYDKADQYADWPPQLKASEHPVKKPKPDVVPYSISTFRAA